MGVEDFLTELDKQFPGLAEAPGEYDEALMHILPPVDPLFRVGELGLAYDSESDMTILVAREVISAEEQPDQNAEAEEDADAVEAFEESEEPDEIDTNTVRLWCTRAQLRAMCRWGLEVASHGRPVCPYCGQPIDPEGHFCPKRNGHKH
jgi:uncharacterized repeat protein (TIGR03847 family)